VRPPPGLGKFSFCLLFKFADHRYLANVHGAHSRGITASRLHPTHTSPFENSTDTSIDACLARMRYVVPRRCTNYPPYFGYGVYLLSQRVRVPQVRVRCPEFGLAVYPCYALSVPMSLLSLSAFRWPGAWTLRSHSGLGGLEARFCQQWSLTTLYESSSLSA